MTRRLHSIAIAASCLVAAACHRAPKPDAYGNFETTEVVVSAEASGRLLTFHVNEGDRLAAGARVGLVDTSALALERAQLLAQQSASAARVASVQRQASSLDVQREAARRDYERLRGLADKQIIPARQLDQAERDYRALDEQAAAMRAQGRGASGDVAAAAARVAQLAERIAKSHVVNPLAGTVLATYAEPGEFVQPGQPLYKVAALDTLILRAYVGETQLASVKLGQPVQVHVDRAEGKRFTTMGTVTWISPKAEFTPTPVQTRDERADLVYAVKIRVANGDGALKIGMPADVDLHARPE
ncbi:MAG TPA: HlyD family efflux transporter periplasmic adaptor subunit [Gemmatimonadaceae bacterium]|nr:HlyD family efflux transporter periplasmic adaptor subunit [Gemmatimonadaceae bacterium]